MFRELPYSPPWPRFGASRGGRVLAAAALRSASAMLERLAHAVAGARAPVQAAAVREPVFEFYAEAGAPEGALFVDGELVGVLAGVSRL